MATLTATEGKLKIDKLLRAFGNRRKSGNAAYGITAPLAFTISVPVSVLQGTDKLRMIRVPSGYFCDEYAVRWLGDADADVTPALVNDHLTETDAGAEDSLKLIGGSTAGRSANEGDRLDDAAVGAYVGGRWIILKNTTPAATAPGAAVNLRVYLRLSFGAIVEGQRVPYTRSA